MKRMLPPLILLAVGVVLMIVALVLGVRGVADAVSSTSTWVGGAPHSVALTQGDWSVYEEVPRGQGSGATLSASDLTVEGPGGSVPVSASAVVGELVLNNRTYVGVGRFTAPTDGTYSISGATEGTSLMLGRPVESTLASAFGYVALLALGGLLALAAVIWLIVAFVTSRSKRHAAPVAAGYGPPAAMGSSPASAPGALPGAPAATPPGTSTGMAPPSSAGTGQWYPDPDDPTQWRWWDGQRWTDQRAPRQ